MNRLPVSAFCSVVLLSFAGLSAFSGCDSLSSVRQKIAAREAPHTHLFKATSRATYEAARVAIDKMGFKFVRGGAAQGELEAVSAIGSGDTLSSSRQITLRMKLDGSVEGATEASVWMSEIIERDSSNHAGMGTGSPLRDTPLYEVFFRNVQQGIDSPKKP